MTSPHTASTETTVARRFRDLKAVVTHAFLLAVPVLFVLLETAGRRSP